MKRSATGWDEYRNRAYQEARRTAELDADSYAAGVARGFARGLDETAQAFDDGYEAGLVAARGVSGVAGNPEGKGNE